MFSYCPLELQNKIKNKIKNINNDAFDESKEIQEIHIKFDPSEFSKFCCDYHSREPYYSDDDDENL